MSNLGRNGSLETPVSEPIHEARTRHSYVKLHPGPRYNILRLILCACRTIGCNRFRRLRGKKLHNFVSKKSRIAKLVAKIQHKVHGIFVRDEIFENIRRTQRLDKGKHNECYASLCKSFVFDWNFRKFRPEQKCLGLYAVSLRIIYRFLIFWTQNYVDFSRRGA